MDFKSEFHALVKKLNINWEIKGLLSKDNRVFSFGTDTKVLSTIFELLCAPLVNQIAENHNYNVEEAPQTIYPDFTLLKSKISKEKIAVDVKTTYRRGLRKDGTHSPFIYTLGSYTSFIRNNTKNILYSFDQYSKHFIIGFLYSRNIDAIKNEPVCSYKESDKIFCPYTDVEYFVQEKYKIVGERPASGNTTNMGSFPAISIKELEEGKGPFTSLGEEAFLDYWRNFDRDSSKRQYTNIKQYFHWKKSLNKGNKI